jgi:hypothetical protein
MAYHFRNIRHSTEPMLRIASLWQIEQFPIPICPIPIEIGRDTLVLVEPSNQVTMAPQA